MGLFLTSPPNQRVQSMKNWVTHNQILSVVNIDSQSPSWMQGIFKFPPISQGYFPLYGEHPMIYSVTVRTMTPMDETSTQYQTTYSKIYSVFCMILKLRYITFIIIWLHSDKTESGETRSDYTPNFLPTWAIYFLTSSFYHAAANSLENFLGSLPFRVG